MSWVAVAIGGSSLLGAGVAISGRNSNGQPAPPATPDYAAVNRDGVYTDIETLPIRRQIEAAARLGQPVTYIDPRTGQPVTHDFSGTGDGDYGRVMAQIMGQMNGDLQRQQLALRQELGAANAAQTSAELRAADPLAYDTRQDITNTVRNRLLGEGPGDYASSDIARAANGLRTLANGAPGPDERLGSLIGQAGAMGSAQRIGDIYGEAQRLPGAARDTSTASLQEALLAAQAEFRMGGQLDPDTKRALMNEVRAGQVARGNYLGDAAAVTEATEIGGAMERRKAERLRSLLDVQSEVFGQNAQLREETSRNAINRISALSGVQGQEFGQNQARIGQMGALIGQDYGQRQQSYASGLNAAQAAFSGATALANDQRSARQENFGYDQQRLANANAVVLGAPITSQFSSLGAAQQGAVGFTPVNFNGGIGLNPNAGAQGASFAQGSFGTQAGMYGTQANIAAQGNPWMALAGNMVGSVGGGIASGIGDRLGNMFGTPRG